MYFFSFKNVLALTLIPLMLFSMLSCRQEQNKPATVAAAAVRNQSQSELRHLQTELKLADSEKPYLVLDLPKSQIEIKLKGAVVWNQPLQIAARDSGRLREFAARFDGHGNKDLRYVWDKHLFAAQERFPDSLLAIVTKVLEVNPRLLQRELPSRFQIAWDDNLILEFRTELKVASKPSFARFVGSLWSALRHPWGQTILVANMPVEDALTLYRVAHPGLPTLIYPDD